MHHNTAGDLLRARSDVDKEPKISEREARVLNRRHFWVARQWVQHCSRIGRKAQNTSYLIRGHSIFGGE